MENKDRIVKVEIWNKETKHNSGVGRAVAGGIIAGGVGAVVGASTAKDKEFVTFIVTYAGGKVDFIETEVGSVAYRIWMQEKKGLEGGKTQISKGEKKTLKVLLIILGLLAVAILLPLVFR